MALVGIQMIALFLVNLTALSMDWKATTKLTSGVRGNISEVRRVHRSQEGPVIALDSGERGCYIIGYVACERFVYETISTIACLWHEHA